MPRAFVEEYTKIVSADGGDQFRQAVLAQEVALLEQVRKGAMVLSADDNAQRAVQAVHDDLW